MNSVGFFLRGNLSAYFSNINLRDFRSQPSVYVPIDETINTNFQLLGKLFYIQVMKGIPRLANENVLMYENVTKQTKTLNSQAKQS